MNRKALTCVSLTLALVSVMGARADDLRDAEQLLCTSVRAMECFPDGVCLEGEPETWNVPRFIRVDLAEKVMTTTEASGEDRSTPFESVEREGERWLLQGTEQSRAFSVVLNETTGLASTGIALDGHVVTVFSYCTPIDTGK